MKNEHIKMEFFFGAFLVLVFFLISCNQKQKNSENNKLVKYDSLSIGNKDFEDFQAHFRPISLEHFNELGDEFNNHFLANEDTLVEVSNAYKVNYLKNMNTENIYYGFKTKLPNKSVILTFYKHYGAENMSNEEVIDTTFFSSLVFSESGKPLSSFRSFGSNLTGIPPTYNMTSTFEYENNRLIFTNYEYSTGKSYSEAQPLSGSDSIYMADLTLSKYCLDFTTNKIDLINLLKRKVKVVETCRNPLPTYLKPVD